MQPEVKEIPQAITLPNVELFDELVYIPQARGPRQPGLGVFYGYSGYGKSAAAWATFMRTRCLYLELGDDVSRKSLLSAILNEMQVPYRSSASVSALLDLIAAELQKQDQPLLIIDEADYLIEKNLVNLVRTILNRVRHLSIILIGEERFLHKLQAWERAARRVLDSRAALPCTLEDIRALADLNAPKLAIGEDLLEEVYRLASGSAGRADNNLTLINQVVQSNGLERIDLESFTRLSPRKLERSTLPKPRQPGEA